MKRPPPLLAEWRDGELLVQDGNHRYEALQRAGEPEAWVVVWADDPDEADRFAGVAERYEAATSAATSDSDPTRS